MLTVTDDPGRPPLKERVIHTRVPESLDSELRRRAQGLGVSVSNLVRNVLNHAFGLVEDVITDSAEVARSARGERDPDAALEDVIGWQTVTLRKPARCTRCGIQISAGTDAALAIGDAARERRFVCAHHTHEEEPTP